jgi:hypothetical protein
MFQGQIHSVHFFLDPSVLWAPTVRTLSETSNDHALCCTLNHGNTLVLLLHCLSLSSSQLESTLSPAAQLLLSQSQHGDLVGHHLRLSHIFERISRPTYEQTLPTVIGEHYFMNILCIGSLSPQKTHTRKLFFGSILLKHGRHFDYSNQPLNMRMRVCYLDSYDVGPSDTHRKPVTSITNV